MVHLVQRRLQVFVSSTYTDLIDVRQAAVEAVLSCGHIPAGMELFTAGDDSQMDVIANWIDQSDVFLLILGGRYGSLHPTHKKSYTQLEFEYAVKKGIPHFACVMTDECLEKRVKEHEKGTRYIETDNVPKLTKFRKSVTSKRVVSQWNDTNELKLAILNKLNELERDPKLVGWIRANSIEATSPAVSEELARLSRENDELRKQVGEANSLIGGLPYDALCSSIFSNPVMATCFNEVKKTLIVNGTYGIPLGQVSPVADLLALLLELNLVYLSLEDEGARNYFLNDNGLTFVARLRLSTESASK